jgi:tetratricopeptide (TPR) repeat protein
VRPGSNLTREIQRILLELKFLVNTGEQSKAIVEAEKLVNLLGRVSVVGAVDSDALKTAVGTAGNCAVQLEKLDMQDRAEKVYRKAIGLYPEHSGVHLQYADLLADLGRIEEAKDEVQRAKTIDPSDPRVSQIEMKIFMASGKIPENLQQRLEQEFNSNPSDDRRAAAYLTVLAQANESARFKSACLKWQEATGNPYTAKRALGDYLASSAKDENMKQAISIYEELRSICPDGDQVAMLHNLATLYYHFDRDAEAEATWRVAYERDKSEAAVQSAFSQLLERKGDLASARNVANGLPIS